MVKSLAMCVLAYAVTSSELDCATPDFIDDAMSALQQVKQNTKLGQGELSVSSRLAQVFEQASTGASQVCVAVLEGETAPVAGIFIPEQGYKRRVARGETSNGPGRFCAEAGVISMLQRSFGLANAANVEQALTAKNKGAEGSTGSKKKSTTTTKSPVVADRLSSLNPQVVISEVADKGSTGVCEGADWLELHNFGADDVDLGGSKLHDDKGKDHKDAFTFSDGTTILAGGYLGLCTGAGDGPQFKIGVDDTITLLDADEGEVSTTRLNRFNAPFVSLNERTWAWDPLLQNHAAEMQNYRWTATPTFGAENVFSMFTQSAATIVINEVAYMANENFPCGGHEWVELYNDGTSEVDITGFKLHDDKGRDDDGAIIFSDATILAGEYLVVCAKKDHHDPDWSQPTLPEGDLKIGKEDTITLIDAEGNVVSATAMPGTGADWTTWSRHANGTYEYTVADTFGEANVFRSEW